MTMNSHPVNRLIQAEVDLFMHKHHKIGKGELAQLEKAVKTAARNASHEEGDQSNAARGSTSRPQTARQNGLFPVFCVLLHLEQVHVCTHTWGDAM